MAMNARGAAEINVTPLIDVLLVLLIIFMIVVPLRSTGLEARVPQPAGDARAADLPATVVVRVREDRSLEINTQPVHWTALADRLRVIFAQRPRGVLFVSAAAEIEFGEVARVIDTARGAGITKVALMR